MLAPALYELPELYDAVVGPGPCETFYGQEAWRAAGPVLELACGTGRLTIPIAQAGHEIVGVDASPAMLAAARSKARGAGRAPMFLEADMRAVALGRRFTLVILSCNSLAHMITIEDLKACLTRIGEHLLPDGTFAFDLVNPDVQLLARPSSESVVVNGPARDSLRVEETANYDPVAQVRTLRWQVQRHGEPAHRLSALRLRQIFPQELPLLLDAAGLRLVARYGDFERGPFTAASPNQICLARLA